VNNSGISRCCGRNPLSGQSLFTTSFGDLRSFGGLSVDRFCRNYCWNGRSIARFKGWLGSPRGSSPRGFRSGTRKRFVGTRGSCNSTLAPSSGLPPSGKSSDFPYGGRFRSGTRKRFVGTRENCNSTLAPSSALPPKGKSSDFPYEIHAA
jgi:hypothetical protein